MTGCAFIDAVTSKSTQHDDPLASTAQCMRRSGEWLDVSRFTGHGDRGHGRFLDGSVVRAGFMSGEIKEAR